MLPESDSTLSEASATVDAARVAAAAAGADVAAGTFDFPAYWRGADVDASLARSPAPGAKLTLTVADEFGASSSVALAPPTRST